MGKDEKASSCYVLAIQLPEVDVLMITEFEARGVIYGGLYSGVLPTHIVECGS